MESNRIDIILEKYFQGETNTAEELKLKKYFSSSNVAMHLEHYTPLFVYFSVAKEQKSSHKLPLQTKKRNVMWLSIAASVVILFGIGTFLMINTNPSVNTKELGSYESPELAFKETQKALALLSSNVNVGIGSVMYVKEYETAKDRVFKK